MGRYLVALVAVGVLLAGAAWGADEPKAEAPKNGTVTGIMTAKGPAWIEVKAEGEKESVRYIPRWIGGLPKDGGGPEAATLEALKKIYISNLVKVTWELQEERRRIVSVEAVAPEKKEGSVIGIIVAKGENWLDVKAEKDSPTERYMPRWVGGLPKDGGGMDKAILAIIKERNLGDKVEIKWSYDERKRLLQLTLLQAAEVKPAETKSGK